MLQAQEELGRKVEVLQDKVQVLHDKLCALLQGNHTGASEDVGQSPSSAKSAPES